MTTDDPRYLPLVDRLLRGQAVRERGAVALFESCLKLAPDAEAHRRLLGHIAEEREHYERVAAVWSRTFGRAEGELDAWVEARLRERPLPAVKTWLELAVAMLLFDRAGRWQISEYVDSSFEPYRALARDIVADERGHETAGATDLAVLMAAPGADRAAAQAAVDAWLPVALESFGRAGGEGNAFAIAAGLKSRDSGDVAREFLAEVSALLTRAGLHIESRSLLATKRGHGNPDG